MADPAGSDRDHAVAVYFSWNADGLVQAVSMLGSAAALLTFAMIDRIADVDLGYHSHWTHLFLLATAIAIAAPIGFRERHAMLALRSVAAAMALACLLLPALGWRIIPPAQGFSARLTLFPIVLAVAAFIPAACVIAATYRQRWQAFLAYCRAPSVWRTPRNEGG